MTYEIKTRKAYDGWQALTTIEIGHSNDGVRILEISTGKVAYGLETRANVYYHKDLEDGTYIRSTMMFQDFFKSGIASATVKRVTEKSVVDLQKIALLKIDEIIKEAKNHYN